MSHQDYLYLFQTCAAIAALISVFIVFKYETLDKYVDNRKEALREMLEIDKFPERAEWIQSIGKGKNNIGPHDEKISELNIPSTDAFIENIRYYRVTRQKLLKDGKYDIFLWAFAAGLYLLAHMLDLYMSGLIQFLHLLFFIPAGHSVWFVSKSLD